MQPRNRLLTLLKSLCVTLICCVPFSASAQVPEISFSGRVIDEANRPIAGADVAFTAPSRQMWSHFLSLERAETPRLVQTSDSDGKYSVRLPTTNTKWLGPGDGVILVRTTSGLLSASKYKLSRGLVDYPMDLRVTNSGTSKVKLVDSQGKPVIDVKVFPGRIGTVMLPWDVTQELSAKPDQNGIVELPVIRAELEAIYVTGPSVGNQFVMVQKDAEAIGRAVVRNASPRQFKCTWLDDLESKAIPKIRWTVISFSNLGDKMEFAWQLLDTQGPQPVTVDNLPAGMLSTITDAASGHGLFAEFSNKVLEEEQTEIEVKVEPGLHVVGKVVSLESGQPIPGVTLQSNSADQHVVSDSQGNYELWLPKLSDGCYPVDPFQEYFYPAAFFVRPGAESAPGEASIPPFELSRSAKMQGAVLDAEGQPVAGATVRCESKQERFVMSNTFLSDRLGKFTIRGIGEGTPVKLSVLDRRGVTESPLEVIVRNAESFEIRLSAPQSKQFTGRIVDRSKRPIAGAVVNFKRGQVVIPAGYNPTEYSLVDAFSKEDLASDPLATAEIVTDELGRFQSNECIDWRGMIGLTVNHSQYYERATWLRDVSQSPAEQRQFDFGDVVLDSLPSSQSISIQVVDKHDQPLTNASVVLIQARDFAGTATTDLSGVALFQAKKTKGLIGVSHKIGTTVESFAGDQSTIKIVLDAEKCRQPLLLTRPAMAERRAVVAKLIEKFEFAKTLDFDKASDGEIVRILSAKAFADPASIHGMLITKLPALAKRGDIGLMAGQSILSRDLKLISKYGSLIPATYRAGFFTEAASKTVSASERETLLAEALQSVRKSAGDEAATSMGRIAMLFLEVNDIDAATELIREVMEAQEQELIASTAQRSKRGVARYFFPQLALVDFELACELIRKHAYPNEIERLHALALTIAVMAKKIDWERGLNHIGRNAFLASEEALVPGAFSETPIPSFEFAKGFSDQLADQRLRGLWQILAAVKVPDASQSDRQQWLNQGLKTLSTSQVSAPTNQYRMLATQLQPHFQKLAEIDPLGARRIVFECLRELSPLQDGQYYYLAERHAAVANLLNVLDKNLGRAMVEPFLSDLTWHIRAGAQYSISPLSTAAYGDPAYAASIVESLIEGEFKEDKLRQASALDDLVSGLAK